MSLPISPMEFLETVAGDRCPCGHSKTEHDPPDPDFKVGDLVETMGVCRVPRCNCKGVLE